jgi:hypothetical protein
MAYPERTPQDLGLQVQIVLLVLGQPLREAMVSFVSASMAYLSTREHPAGVFGNYRSESVRCSISNRCGLAFISTDAASGSTGGICRADLS